MKGFAAILVLFSVVVYSQQEMPEAMKAKMKPIQEKCVKETGANPELFEKSRHGEAVTDKAVKCMYKCMMTNLGIMDASGKIEPNNFGGQGVIPEDKRAKLMEIGNKCKEQKPADPSDLCETAYAFHMCTAPEKAKLFAH